MIGHHHDDRLAIRVKAVDGLEQPLCVFACLMRHLEIASPIPLLILEVFRIKRIIAAQHLAHHFMVNISIMKIGKERSALGKCRLELREVTLQNIGFFILWDNFEFVEPRVGKEDGAEGIAAGVIADLL